MTIRTLTVYRVDCNSCRAPLIFRGSADLPSVADLQRALEVQNWLALADGRHFCTSCAEAIGEGLAAVGRSMSKALAAAKRKASK